MRIIITGASGFVGRNLQQYLKEEGYSVKPVSLRDDNWRSHTKVGDAIIHLAGKAHDTANTSSEEAYFQINRDLTIDLFDEYLKSNITTFVYFSSVKAVADTVTGTLTEAHDSRPCTPYGVSKMQAEQYLLNKKLPDSKRLIIIRPCMIHGPGNKGNLNLLYSAVEKGLPWPLATFHNQRSFLSIDNLNYLIKYILDTDCPSGVYNFADDEWMSTNELVALIADSLGRKPRLMHIPKILIHGAARIGDFLSLPLNSERVKKLTESYIVSNEKIKKALGIEKLPLTVKEGLVKTIRSFADRS